MPISERECGPKREVSCSERGLVRKVSTPIRPLQQAVEWEKMTTRNGVGRAMNRPPLLEVILFTLALRLVNDSATIGGRSTLRESAGHGFTKGRNMASPSRM